MQQRQTKVIGYNKYKPGAPFLILRIIRVAAWNDVDIRCFGITDNYSITMYTQVKLECERLSSRYYPEVERQQRS